MSLDRDAAFLVQLPLFRHFEPDQIKLAVFNASHQTFEQGSRVFARGEKAPGAMIVLSGEIGIMGAGRHDGRVLERLGPGAVIAEMALLVDTGHSHDGQALSQAELLIISRPVFKRVLEEYPQTAELIHQDWTARLDAAMANIRKVAPKFTVRD